MTFDGGHAVLEATIRLALSDGNRVVAVADSIEALLGFAPGDFLSGQVSLKDLIHPDDFDIAGPLFSLEAGAPCGAFNIRLRSASGRIRCLKGHCSKETRAGKVELGLLLQDARSLRRTLPDAATMVNFKAMMDNTDDYIYFKDRNHVFTGASQSLVSLCAPAEHWSAPQSALQQRGESPLRTRALACP